MWTSLRFFNRHFQSPPHDVWFPASPNLKLAQASPTAPEARRGNTHSELMEHTCTLTHLNTYTTYTTYATYTPYTTYTAYTLTHLHTYTLTHLISHFHTHFHTQTRTHPWDSVAFFFSLFFFAFIFSHLPFQADGIVNWCTPPTHTYTQTNLNVPDNMFLGKKGHAEHASIWVLVSNSGTYPRAQRRRRRRRWRPSTGTPHKERETQRARRAREKRRSELQFERKRRERCSSLITSGLRLLKASDEKSMGYRGNHQVLSSQTFWSICKSSPRSTRYTSF